MLKTRLASAAIGIPILLGLSYLGGWYWQILVLVMAGVALFEYLQMMFRKQLHPIYVPAYLLMLALLFTPHLGQLQGEAVFLSILAVLVVAVVRYPFYTQYDVALSLFGAGYTGYFLSYALQLSASSSFVILWYVFFLTWSSDVGGYTFGSLWGRHHLAPLLSPNKTWEGVLGGFVFCMIISVIAYWGKALAGISLSQALILGITASAAAQLGDLLESSLKRFFEVKDSGRIIPGHGGVLDRFDSFMLVLPTVYYLLQVYGL